MLILYSCFISFSFCNVHLLDMFDFQLTFHLLKFFVLDGTFAFHSYFW